MKSSVLTAVMLLIIMGCSDLSFSQQRIESNAYNGYVPVHTYAGVINQNTFGYQIHLYGSNIHVPGWSLAVKVNGQIQNSEGKILDPSKLRMKINHIIPEPSLDQIGTTNAPVPISQSLSYIFKNSRYPLFTTATDHYKLITLSFDVHVEGGAYLEALKSWQEYTLNVVFQVQDQHGRVITEAPYYVKLQIHPNDAVPTGPTYSIQLMATAASGTLEFTNPQEFTSGVEQNHPRGLSVISSTPYQLQVRSLNTNFTANSLTVPVNTVGLTLRAPSTNRSGTITLSGNPQVVISNEPATGRDARLYDIRYFTLPNDLRLLKAVPANYSTTLMYTLTPQ